MSHCLFWSTLIFFHQLFVYYTCFLRFIHSILFRGIQQKVKFAHSCPTLSDPMDCIWLGSEPFPSQGDFPNPGIKPRSPSLQAFSLPSEQPGKPKNTEVGNLYFLQWIFLAQGLNPSLLHCRHILYQLSQQESPRILKWVIYPFSSRSSQPRNQTRVSCIACGFFTS